MGCKICGRYIESLGIASHRSMHHNDYLKIRNMSLMDGIFYIKNKRKLDLYDSRELRDILIRVYHKGG